MINITAVVIAIIIEIIIAIMMAITIAIIIMATTESMIMTINIRQLAARQNMDECLAARKKHRRWADGAHTNTVTNVGSS